MWYRKKRIYAVLFICVMIILFLDANLLGRLMYPMKYESVITEKSLEHEVDPYLVTAIIKVESNFKPEKRSPKGAVGLMQLMPATAEWIADQSGYAASPKDRLYEPEVNIDIGARYVQTLGRQFIGEGEADKTREIALIAAAYNAGPGNVAKWLDSGRWDGSLDAADQVPFGETRHYIHRVYYYYTKYSQTYPNLDVKKH
jgi:soluble lytic murein transglycosylase